MAKIDELDLTEIAKCNLRLFINKDSGVLEAIMIGTDMCTMQKHTLSDHELTMEAAKSFIKKPPVVNASIHESILKDLKNIEQKGR